MQLGAYAQLVSAHVRMPARKPASPTWEQAAGVPLAGLTAYQSIKRVGVREGETVLAHAAAGGVGMFGAQIAARSVAASSAPRANATTTSYGSWAPSPSPTARARPTGSASWCLTAWTRPSTSSAATRWTSPRRF